MRTRLSGSDWRVCGFVPGDALFSKVAENPGAVPAHPWVPAVVPGHVQSDLVDAGVLPDPFVDSQSLQCEWTSVRDWAYEKRFAAPPGPAVLRFDGVDHDCVVFLNGERLGEHSGMFGFSFDVQLRSDNTLVVVVMAAPPSEDELGDTTRVTTWKARFPYWWDFSARLVPQGIWGDVWLEPADGLGEVHVQVGPAHVDVQARAGALVEVHGPDGALVVSGAPGRIEVPGPVLWWPNGFGDQPLYTVTTSFGDDRDVRRVGFRSLSFDDFDLVVNGASIPVLGWNWVPVHQLYGREHAESYRHLVERARRAGATVLRIWGGGLLERELFYDLCDDAGILVWQDFLQSSSAQNCEPAVDEAYLDHAAEQARAMVRARRHHASLFLWSAGNELATGPERLPLTDEHPNAQVLRSVAEDEDPGRPWLVTTPTGDVPFAQKGVAGLNVHGSYWHLGLDEHADFYASLECRFQGEVGCHGAANVETLRRSLTQPWPRDAHWWHKGSWWQRHEVLEAAFGEIDDLDRFVAASQWLQAHGLRAIVEAARGRWPQQTGVLLWQLNEPWPNSACSSVIDVYGHVKPGYWAVAEAFRAAAPIETEVRWYDAVTGARTAGPVEGGLSVRVQGGRQEVVHDGAETPLRPLLGAHVDMQVTVEGSVVHVRAAGGPLHGVFVQTVEDHGGPYVDEGWRWFVPSGESWTFHGDRKGSLTVSALNAPAVLVELS